MNKLIFQGPAQVCLQGKDALKVLTAPAATGVAYAVGDAAMTIQVLDLRREPNEEALKALTGGVGDDDFLVLFNRPAGVEVRVDRRGSAAEITLLDLQPGAAPPDPTLWLGVLEVEWIPAMNMTWDLFLPLDEARLAFAAIIQPDLHPLSIPLDPAPAR